MKFCTRCNKSKDISEYGKNKSRPDGLGANCKTCVSEINKKYYRTDKGRAKKQSGNKKSFDRNTKFMNDYLEDNPCVDCGESDIEVLQFDHIVMVRGKNKRVSDYIKCSLNRLVEEINKCQVRCGNCHIRRTRQQMGTSRLKPL